MSYGSFQKSTLAKDGYPLDNIFDAVSSLPKTLDRECMMIE